MCSLASGMMVTPSRARRASIHSAAQASSDIFVDPRDGLQTYGLFRISESAPPRSCQSPPIASAAARIDQICAPT
jgi:hypothetical protein